MPYTRALPTIQLMPHGRLPQIPPSRPPGDRVDVPNRMSARTLGTPHAGYPIHHHVAGPSVRGPR
jgi:hypothetical protein